MFRFRLGVSLVVSAVAVVVVSGMAANAASGTVFTLGSAECTGGTFINLCWSSAGVLKELEGEQTWEVAKQGGSGNLVFHLVLGEEAFTIECEAVRQGRETDVITQLKPLSESGKFSGSLMLEKCKLTAPAALAKKCLFPESKETLALTMTYLSGSELELRPTAGVTSPILQFTFANNGTETCSATFKTGEHAISGFQVIKIIDPETPGVTKSGATIEKSGLKFVGIKAEWKGAMTFSFPGLGDEVGFSKTS